MDDNGEGERMITTIDKQIRFPSRNAGVVVIECQKYPSGSSYWNIMLPDGVVRLEITTQEEAEKIARTYFKIEAREYPNFVNVGTIQWRGVQATEAVVI